MNSRRFFHQIATTAAIASILLSITADFGNAATKLTENGTVNGFVQTSSPKLRYRDQSRFGSPVLTAPGEEYTFYALQGDLIQAQVQPEDGSRLAPVLVLMAPDQQRQVAFQNRTGMITYRVPVSGEYKLMVLGRNNTLGRYKLAMSGVSKEVAQQPLPTTPQVDSRKQILQNEYGLSVLDSCPPATGSLAVIYFPEANQTYTYCARPNRFVRVGTYTYDAASGDLKPGAPVTSVPQPANDPKRQQLQNEFGLRVLDNCPPATSSLVVINYPEGNETYRYCATPNRLFPAGQYRYDVASGDLLKVGTGTGTGTGTGSTTLDERAQLLKNEFGLNVLNNCPANKTGLVVVAYPEAGQTYTYCANPNRVFTAGDYAYNATRRSLDRAQRTQDCTISVGGICILK